jgi:RHS repeat-associated protein
MTDGTGTTTNSYYPVGQLGAEQLASVSNSFTAATIIYKYDELGRITNRAIDGVNEGMAFDGLNRIANHVTALGQFAEAYADATTRPASISGPVLTNSFSYSGNNGDLRLSGISYSYATHSSSALASFAYQYDVLGRVTEQMKYSSSSTEEFKDMSYDAEGQVLSSTVYPWSPYYFPGGGFHLYPTINYNPNPHAYTYNYDVGGNRVRAQFDQTGTNPVPVTVSKSAYNNVNQLTNRSGAAPLPVEIKGIISEQGIVAVNGQTANVFANTETPAGGQMFIGMMNSTIGTNVVQIVATDYSGNYATNNYAINVVGDLGKSYRYDVNGNCTNLSMVGTNIWYEWDAENRMIAINTYVTNTATLQRSEFTYDGFDRSVQIVEKTNGTIASTKRFVWCDAQRCQERDGGNAVTKRFFYEGEQIGGTNYFYLRDYLGSVQQVVDGTGAIRAQYEYDPYGHQNKLQGNMDSDFGFAGYYRHATSGLYLTMFRAYDADSGRWLNRDPIQEAGGLNLYGYVGNNPINRIDPLGLDFVAMFSGWNPYYVPPPPAPRPSGIFIFAGGELPAPGRARAAMDYEGATFFGYNKNSGVTLGSFNCITTKRAARIGSGKESGFSSAIGPYIYPVSLYDAHLPLPGISPGIGDISTPNANSPYFYLQGGKGGFAGLFLGIGVDFDK